MAGADLIDEFQIRKLLAQVQRADAHFGFVALDSIDDSD
jgi:hypothetical protein